MGRFTVLKPHQILGTKETVYVKPLTAVESSTFRKTLLATLIPAQIAARVEADEKATAEDIAAAQAEANEAEAEREKAQGEMVAGQVYDDAAGTIPTFGGWEQVRADLNPAQLEDVALVILDESGYTAASREAARRFRDSEGASGGVADSPGGEGVQPAAE